MSNPSEHLLRKFPGFPAGKSDMVQVPNRFFSDLLPLIDDLAELKLTIYCFWAVQQREGEYRYARLRDLREDRVLLASLADDPAEAERLLATALERATMRGALLHVLIPGPPAEDLYFMNTDRGRRAVAALERGDWLPGDVHQPVASIVERPNIFTLYEQNIGPLTPIMSDKLKDAENTYPEGWIKETIGLAVENNKRSWSYVEAILKRWASEGHPAKKGSPTPDDDVHPYLRDPYFRRSGDEP